MVGDTLTLRGERKADPGTGEHRYHRRERGHGSFSRVVRLPYEVDAETAAARLAENLEHMRNLRAEVSELPVVLADDDVETSERLLSDVVPRLPAARGDAPEARDSLETIQADWWLADEQR